MMPRLSCSSYTFEAIPLEGALAIVKAIGVKAVDIAGFHQRGKASYEPDEVGAHPQHYADHLNALLDKYELKPIDFFPQFGAHPDERSINDPDPAVRQKDLDAFRGIVQFCQLTGMHSITLLPGVDHPGKSKDENMAQSAEMLRVCADIAGETGITLCFEPHMGSLAHTPELALELVERAPGAKITLDYSHYLLQYIPLARIHPLIPHTGHFHIRQARPGKLQTRFSEGTLDFLDIAQRLEAAGYQGCMSLEYICSDWYDMNQIDTLYETMATKEALQPHLRL
jgi:sugar phosphate isomerase/epimerase